VLTKGWSRFVKEKNLLPGDTVAFEKGHDDLLYIAFTRSAAVMVSTVHIWGGATSWTSLVSSVAQLVQEVILEARAEKLFGQGRDGGKSTSKRSTRDSCTWDL
jgi:hypothetical protein